MGKSFARFEMYNLLTAHNQTELVLCVIGNDTSDGFGELGVDCGVWVGWRPGSLFDF